MQGGFGGAREGRGFVSAREGRGFVSAREGRAVELELPRGICTVSIDLESVWGSWDTICSAKHRDASRYERDACARLVTLLDRNDIRATWAVVGRLFDEKVRAPLTGPTDNWFAPDLLDLVTTSSLDHEIASHSYGHVHYHATTRDEAERDLTAAKNLHGRYGLDFVSFTFPGNTPAHTSILKKVGLRVFRGADRGVAHIAGRLHGGLTSAFAVADEFISDALPAVRPLLHTSGLVELPTSMHLAPRQGARAWVPTQRIERRALEAIRYAASHKTLFHLRLSPKSLYFATDAQVRTLTSIFEEVRTMQDKRLMEVRTMGSFAALVHPLEAKDKRRPQLQAAFA